jgi:hypothetical protein
MPCCGVQRRKEGPSGLVGGGALRVWEEGEAVFVSLFGGGRRERQTDGRTYLSKTGSRTGAASVMERAGGCV